MSTIAELPTLHSTAPDDVAVEQLRGMAIRSLRRMVRPGEDLFAFRLRRGECGPVLEGTSRRYTAIVLIGLASEGSDVWEAVLGVHAERIIRRMLQDLNAEESLGTVALVLWAAKVCRLEGVSKAAARLSALDPCGGRHPTVDLAWALAALSIPVAEPVCGAPDAIATKLMSAWEERSGLFPHWPRGHHPSRIRGHVACFADQVYPIQALALHHLHRRNEIGLGMAGECARRICELQGPAGQWWWHYDVRTGKVIEGYPVYSVHQDAMAPMALFALKDAGGPDFSSEVMRGMDWLMHPPEVSERLVDTDADVIWRKVARREPPKLSRGLNALASRVHPSLRVPGITRLFPPSAVDYESRPYHLGWLLHAWSPARMARRRSKGTG